MPFGFCCLNSYSGFIYCGVCDKSQSRSWALRSFRHKFFAIIIFIYGFYLNIAPLTLSALILFEHSPMDRFFGSGLKLDDDFKRAHLRWTEKKRGHIMKNCTVFKAVSPK
jgi:hypothetical protein